jgi:neutral ceramidase
MQSLSIALSLAGALLPAPADTYLIGRAVADITLPPVGVPMLGFMQPDHIGEGLHQRQYARTFVIADATDTSRVALVTCDFAFPTHTLKLAIVERLESKLGKRYGFGNVVLAGTHTHSAPGGFHHHLSASQLGGMYFGQCFDVLVDGISESIVAADADLKPGRILIAQGDVEGAGVNRSRVAYMLNPAAERARYPSDVDTTMTLLKFERDGETIGILNWFPVHCTSMTYHNRLISGDNKGYAAYAMERKRGTLYRQRPEFVAAFAQSNAGDVTPNLNLNNTGPGETDLESTRIIGSRQARVAEKLLEQATVPLRGSIDVRHAFVDFSRLTVSDAFTGAGQQRTCPSAFGYSFAAGSAEDGGGHPLFEEGTKDSRWIIDRIVRIAASELHPTAQLSRCQRPKAVLFATGLPKPPAQEQILPLGIVRIGQLVLAVGPAEFTTMSGRRIRSAVAAELGIDPRLVVIAGYANDYAGYVSTREEYESQQYEGGHTLFGPWTEAGYRQEFSRLARAMKTGQPVTSTVFPEDMRLRSMASTPLDGPNESSPPLNSKFGDVAENVNERYVRGERVSAVFWTGSPVNEYRRGDRFMAVERYDPATGRWEPVRSDFDWDTTCRWRQMLDEPERKSRRESRLEAWRVAPPPRIPRPQPHQATVSWHTSTDTDPGIYQIVHYGRYKQFGQVVRFVATSKPFEVR